MNPELGRWYERSLNNCATMLNIYTNRIAKSKKEEKERLSKFYFWLGKLDAFRRCYEKCKKTGKVREYGE